jgi:hypothetical protein
MPTRRSTGRGPPPLPASSPRVLSIVAQTAGRGRTRKEAGIGGGRRLRRDRGPWRTAGCRTRKETGIGVGEGRARIRGLRRMANGRTGKEAGCGKQRRPNKEDLFWVELPMTKKKAHLKLNYHKKKERAEGVYFSRYCVSTLDGILGVILPTLLISQLCDFTSKI